MVMACKLKDLVKELNSLENKKQAKLLQGFFKTGKGEYGEGDIFLGIKVPVQRKVAKKYLCLSLDDLQQLLKSSIHEHRLVALMILVDKFNKSNDDKKHNKKQIVDFYLSNSHYINNWDLVDLSSPRIIGMYLLDKPESARRVLYDFAKSSNLWEKRIAIISTLAFIKNKQYADTLQIAEILLNDKHDLIHKAVGWMLREVGKMDVEVEESFLKKHYKQMPRTMLRYAIERFDEGKRKHYLLS